MFEPSASVADRQAAIDGVSGTVIGGMRPQNREGVYIVLLPHDTTNARVFDAVSALRSSLGVLAAVPGMVLTTDACTVVKQGQGSIAPTRPRASTP